MFRLWFELVFAVSVLTLVTAATGPCLPVCTDRRLVNEVLCDICDILWERFSFWTLKKVFKCSKNPYFHHKNCNSFFKSIIFSEHLTTLSKCALINVKYRICYLSLSFPVFCQNLGLADDLSHRETFHSAMVHTHLLNHLNHVSPVQNKQRLRFLSPFYMT